MLFRTYLPLKLGKISFKRCSIFGNFSCIFNYTKMTGEPNAKQIKPTKKIGTHNGVFHCDELLACYMLKKLPQYQEAEIIRSRDDTVLDTCDIVVDVGGIYDPVRHRYDHHQRSFTESMNSLCKDYPWKTRLSSAGLVYYHFGHDILKILLEGCDEGCLNAIYKHMYEYFIQEIDGVDNGVPMFDGEPSYRITTNLSARVGSFNIPWNSAETDESERFFKAYDLVGKEFEDRIKSLTEIWWPARSIVKKAIESRFEIHKSGEIIEFPGGRSCPWKEHLFELEKELEVEPNIKFVLFRDIKGTWRIQAVPVAVGSYICRLFLRDEWQGLRDSELSKVVGIDDCIFVHSTGFIGGHKTRDGVFQMAIQCLEKRNSSDN